MRERRHCLGLALEARAARRLAGERGGRILIATSRSELGVVGAIHLAHAAAAEGRHNLVLTEPGARSQRSHRWSR